MDYMIFSGSVPRPPPFSSAIAKLLPCSGHCINPAGRLLQEMGIKILVETTVQIESRNRKTRPGSHGTLVCARSS